MSSSAYHEVTLRMTVLVWAFVIAASAGACLAEEVDHEGHDGFQLFSLVVPSGIATLSLMALTVAFGLARRAKRLNTRIVLRIHKTCGVCAFCAGIAHATIVLLIS